MFIGEEKIPLDVICFDKKFSKTYKYLLEQLKLFANLVYDKNFLWKKKLENIFPLDFIFSQITSDRISDSNKYSYKI